MAAARKTVKTKASVKAFLDTVEDDERRVDCKAVSKLMTEASGAKACMWGEAIVGFGEYETRSGPWPVIAFSPRKADLTLYLMGIKKETGLLAKLGKHKLGGGCLYVKRLADLDQKTLRDLMARSVKYVRGTYGCG
jgi:hypothetical protein